MNKTLFTRCEVAKTLGISEASVIELCRSQQLRSVKIGRNVRIHADDLAEFARTGTDNRTVSGKPLDLLWRSKRAA